MATGSRNRSKPGPEYSRGVTTKTVAKVNPYFRVVKDRGRVSLGLTLNLN